MQGPTKPQRLVTKPRPLIHSLAHLLFSSSVPTLLSPAPPTPTLSHTWETFLTFSFCMHPICKSFRLQQELCYFLLPLP